VLVQARALVRVVAFGWTPWQPIPVPPRIPLRYQDCPVEFVAVSFLHGGLFVLDGASVRRPAISRRLPA